MTREQSDRIRSEITDLKNCATAVDVILRNAWRAEVPVDDGEILSVLYAARSAVANIEGILSGRGGVVYPVRERTR